MRSLVALLVIASRAARADVIDSKPTLPGEREAAAAFAASIDYELRTRWQSELSLFDGGAPIDGVAAWTTPRYSLASGLHRDRLTLLGEYSLAGIRYRAPSATMSALGDVVYTDTTGLLHRFGATARYAFVKRTSGQGIVRSIGELWLEGGVGEEIARWDRGGTFARPDVVVGIGLQGARRASSSSRVGFFVALRFQVGRRTDVDGAPPTCTAPCTMASQPAQWADRTALLHVGFLFGN
jgi:hypothetical protein